MDISFLTSLVLCACALFAAISAFSNLSVVPWFRLLRAAHFPASLSILAFEVVLVTDGRQGFWGLIAVIFAILMGMGTQLRALEAGRLATVWFAGVAPWMLISGTLANLKGLPIGAQLPLLVLVPAVLAAVCMWWVDSERNENTFVALGD